MNLANKLTFARTVMTIIFLVTLLSSIPYGKTFSLLLFILAAMTDTLDGIVARRYNIVTSFGKLMDPLSDKILVSAAFVSFVQLKEVAIPAWMVIVIISREFMITGLRLVASSRGKIISAAKWGKHKTTSQMTTILLILIYLSLSELTPTFWATHLAKFFPTLKLVLMSVTVALTLLSGFLYLMQNRKVIGESL